MKIKSTSFNTYVTNTKMRRNENNSEHKLECREITQLGFAVSGAHFLHPSFRAGLSLPEQLKIETQNKINKYKDDYLWAMGWNKEAAKKEYELEAANEIDIKKTKFFGFYPEKNREVIRDKYRGYFERDLKRYNQVIEHIDDYKAYLKEDIATRHISISEIMKSSKGELNSKIAGYSLLKQDMNREFIGPIKDELVNGNEKEVANCIVLCGPTGCGKTVAAEAMANETGCFVERVETDTNPKQFQTVLDVKIAEAKARYFERQQKILEFKSSDAYQAMDDKRRQEELLKIGSPRTVILIDEFDKYFNPLIVKPETINSNTKYLKNALDGCAELPKQNNKVASAVTLLCTTNYPSRIDEDLGIGKCNKYGILPPEGQDMIDVIKHYMKNANILIEDYMSPDKPELKKIDIDKIDLKKFADYFKPNEETGAFSNDAIQFMVMDAADSYIERPDLDYGIHLIRQFKFSPRDITPTKYERYMQELELLDIAGTQTALPEKEKVGEREYLRQYIELYEENIEFFSPAELKKFNSMKARYLELLIADKSAKEKFMAPKEFEEFQKLKNEYKALTQGNN